MFLSIAPALAHLLLYLIACCCACFAHARFVQLRCGGICKWHAEGLDEGDELEDRHLVMSTVYWCATTDWQVQTRRVDASQAGEDGEAMCRIWFQRSYETNNISRATQLAACQCCIASLVTRMLLVMMWTHGTDLISLIRPDVSRIEHRFDFKFDVLNHQSDVIAMHRVLRGFSKLFGVPSVRHEVAFEACRSMRSIILKDGHWFYAVCDPRNTAIEYLAPVPEVMDARA